MQSIRSDAVEAQYPLLWPNFGITISCKIKPMWRVIKNLKYTEISP